LNIDNEGTVTGCVSGVDATDDKRVMSSWYVKHVCFVTSVICFILTQTLIRWYEL